MSAPGPAGALENYLDAIAKLIAARLATCKARAAAEYAARRKSADTGEKKAAAQTARVTEGEARAAENIAAREACAAARAAALAADKGDSKAEGAAIGKTDKSAAKALTQIWKKYIDIEAAVNIGVGVFPITATEVVPSILATKFGDILKTLWQRRPANEQRSALGAEKILETYAAIAVINAAK